ncbi:hypothetical protein HDC94_002337 [Leifsonia sp. AK011]|nr:hypothetical protein [Leifsonia sp. AK011]
MNSITAYREKVASSLIPNGASAKMSERAAMRPMSL